MKVVIDYERCNVNAICATIAPEIFEVGEDDQLRVLQESPPAALRAQLEQAVQLCPTRAISIEED